MRNVLRRIKVTSKEEGEIADREKLRTMTLGTFFSANLRKDVEQHLFEQRYFVITTKLSGSTLLVAELDKLNILRICRGETLLLKELRPEDITSINVYSSIF